MAVEYGTIGIRPMRGWDPDTKYDLLNLVDHDGSSYVAHTDPPKGSLPTDTNYWQTSAQGTSKATADSVGTVKPDGTTTEVSTDGSLSVKTATQDALGLVKGSDGINVGSDGAVNLNTDFTQATELANIIAEEAIASVLGKISKSIAVTMNLDQNALLKNMLTNMDANDPNKINTAAYVHTLTERIGMGEELTAGANLTAAVNEVNSNLNNKVNTADLVGIYSKSASSGSASQNVHLQSANVYNVYMIFGSASETVYFTLVSTSTTSAGTKSINLGGGNITSTYVSNGDVLLSIPAYASFTIIGRSNFTIV